MTRELTIEQCLAIYEQGVQAGPLLHRELLEGAIAAPYASYGGVEAFPTLIEKAARLAFGIAQAQAYRDGNKRLAWLCTVTFLGINGTSLDVDQDEAAHVIRALGEHKSDGTPLLDLEGLTDWFIDCVSYSPDPLSGDRDEY